MYLVAGAIANEEQAPADMQQEDDDIVQPEGDQQEQQQRETGF